METSLRRFPKLRLLWLPVVLVLLDQATKYWAVSYLKPRESIPVIGRQVTFRYLENRGAAWGMLSGKLDVLSILTVILMLFLLYLVSKVPAERRFLPITVCLLAIISGAFGNLIDRIWRHHVVDFISFDVINFPVFNVADIYVTCCTILLAILILFKYKENELKFLPFFGDD